jgi:GrpB-like predicted nucleotidyltransferase (UPF0157 family)
MAKTGSPWEERVAEEPVRIVSYDSGWPERYEKERALIAETIGTFTTDIHHVGSTAVAGLAAKPVIDILVGVTSLEASRVCFEPLAQIGYLYAPYLSEEMHWFCKPHPSRRTHHLHLVPTDSARYRDELLLRDYLRANPGAASEYAALKDELARRFRSDREAYTNAKGAFIERSLATARGS